MKKNELDRLNSKIQLKSTFVETLRKGIAEVIVGQNDLICLLYTSDAADE